MYTDGLKFIYLYVDGYQIITLLGQDKERHLTLVPNISRDIV